jgi:ATP-dependent DNA helicase Q1
MMGYAASCSDHTKIIISLLQEMQQNDQRATLLQLLDKFKTKWKHLGK